ncbi:zinc finger BED domain-containing protein RICESLEEPER 2-like [Bidens hawaiensis]|uniref:zinc finger BED domain-containing protein RICESLEEPER 2-like n=1 Tax=Bidens hawaiensis TaxID=980011 RepID=UPI00404AC0FB
MVLTVHYIDEDWNLQKKILNFEVISNHRGDTIGKMAESCLIAWGIERVFTVTVDNASSNDTAISFLKNKIQNWGHAILDAQYLHMRCCAHVLNLIVCAGLKDYDPAIQVIRNVVSYVRSSPSRLAKFKECAKIEKLNVMGTVCLDVSTRWNSTYLMLESALKYRKAFNRSLYVTSSAYFHDICSMHAHIDECIGSKDVRLSCMALDIKVKYDKYWGDGEKMNPLLYVAVVLDPLYKLKYVNWSSEEMYPIGNIANNMKKKLKSTLIELYDFYCAKDPCMPKNLLRQQSRLG